MIQIPELDIEVEDVSDFNDQASEILEEFCIDLSKQEGMCRLTRVLIPFWTKPTLLIFGKMEQAK